jgi:hypothetical protein
MVCTRVSCQILALTERTWYHRLVGGCEAPSLRLHQRILP